MAFLLYSHTTFVSVHLFISSYISYDNHDLFVFNKSECSGMASFPSILTEEEEALQKKYAKLKKKVRHDPQFLYFFGHTTDIRVI